VDAAVTALTGGRNQDEQPVGEPALRELIASSLVTPADPLTEIMSKSHAISGGNWVTCGRPPSAAACCAGSTTVHQVDQLSRIKDVAMALFGWFGLSFETIEGGCFALGRIDAVTEEDSTIFCERLVREHGVLSALGRPSSTTAPGPAGTCASRSTARWTSSPTSKPGSSSARSRPDETGSKE
jgi:hypothetical protein